MTKVYSTLIFVIAAIMALILGMSPKFGAILQTIPPLFLLVLRCQCSALSPRPWRASGSSTRLIFADSRNLFTVGVALIFGAGDFTLNIGNFALGGIATSTLAALVLYQLLGIGRSDS